MSRPIGTWLDAVGAGPDRFEHFDELATGPLPSRLDDAGCALRAGFWNTPEIAGEKALRARITGDVVVWVDGTPGTALLRAWVRTVVDAAGIGAVWTGRITGRTTTTPWTSLVAPSDEHEARADQVLWKAATSLDPHEVDALRTSVRDDDLDVRRALLRQYPDAVTGLDHWEHALLDRLLTLPALHAAVGRVMGHHPGSGIGDLTLMAALSRLERHGAVTIDRSRSRGDPPVCIEPLGHALIAREATVLGVARYGTVGGVQLEDPTGVWATEGAQLRPVRVPRRPVSPDYGRIDRTTRR
ncbi:MAG: hypothetical protein R3F61_35140 [Myxococcota bacterium]